MQKESSFTVESGPRCAGTHAGALRRREITVHDTKKKVDQNHLPNKNETILEPLSGTRYKTTKKEAGYKSELVGSAHRPSS